ARCRRGNGAHRRDGGHLAGVASWTVDSLLPTPDSRLPALRAVRYQPVASRGRSGNLLERAREMRLIGEPGIKRDGRERCFTIAQAFARKLDPHSPLFLGNAAMVNAAEDRRDALGRLSDFRREIFERQARAEAFADEAFDAV